MKLIRTIIGTMAVAFGLTSVAVWAAQKPSPEKESSGKSDTIKSESSNKAGREGRREPVCAGG